MSIKFKLLLSSFFNMEGENFIEPIKPKKRKFSFWKKLIVGLPILFIAVLMATMVLGSWNPLEEEQQEGIFDVSGYTFFELEDNTYGTYVVANDNKIPVAFRLDPRNASQYYIEEGIVNNILNSAKIYITFNPNQENLAKLAVASAEISRITGLYGIPTVGAYTEDSEPINENVPLRTCADASDTVTVINMELSDSNSVTLDGACVFVSAENVDDLILVADKLGMNLLGINV